MADKIAIYAGTFDPMTFGHTDILLRSSRIFDNLIVAVAGSTPKDTLFSVDERVAIVQGEVVRLGLEHVKVKPFNGLLVDFVANEESNIIIRGLRALSDFEYEFQMAFMNYKISPDIETIFIPASENGNFISSKFVKELASLGENLNSFVSENVAKKLREKYDS